MAIWSAGDSIAVGLANYSGQPTSGYARGGIPVGDEMFRYISAAFNSASPGDTVIISAGYNGGLDANGDRLESLIASAPEGVTVAIMGLRETWDTNQGYDHLRGVTTGYNDRLREIAASTGAVFVEDSIDVANGLPAGEIHGDYQGLFAAATSATPSASPAGAVAETPDASASPTESETPEPATDVTRIQELCRDLGFAAGHYGPNRDGVDGVLGPATERSMRQVIEAAGLTVSPEQPLAEQFQTAADYLQSVSELSREEVMALQMQLKEQGHPAGEYGATRDGVDGIMGPATLRSMQAVIEAADVPAEGSLMERFQTATQAAAPAEDAAVTPESPADQLAALPIIPADMPRHTAGR